MKKHIPNFITLLSLLTAVSAITLYALDRSWLVYLPLFLAISLVLDVADGLSARLLNARSDIGGLLDSLTDLVAFGVQPALAFALCLPTLPWLLLPGIFALFAAWRLAQFSASSEQEKAFKGIPSPAAAIAVAGLLYLLPGSPLLVWAWPWELVLAIMLLFGLFMVLPFRAFSFKMSYFRWKGNGARYLLLMVSVPALLYFGGLALPFLVLFYVLLSFIYFPS